MPYISRGYHDPGQGSLITARPPGIPRDSGVYPVCWDSAIDGWVNDIMRKPTGSFLSDHHPIRRLGRQDIIPYIQ